MLSRCSEALLKAKQLGSRAFGLALVRNGFAIRVNEHDKVAVEKELNPILSQLVGDTLLAMPKADRIMLEARGVPRDMDDCDFIQQTSMTHSCGERWTCKPEKLAPGGKVAPGVKKLLVSA